MERFTPKGGGGYGVSGPFAGDRVPYPTALYSLYEGRFGATQGGENTTLAMIDEFVRTGAVESRYMTAEERAYLTANRKAAPRTPRGKDGGGNR